MKKLLLIFIFAIGLTSNASAQQTHLVYYNQTTTVPDGIIHNTCDIGDTLKFYGTIPAMYAILINSVVVISPISSNTSPYYIGYYVIVGSENSFSINNTWNGTITVNVATSLNEKNSSANIKLFPNPVINVLQVSVLNKTNLMVYTTTGQVVITKLLEAGANEVDVSKLADGIYYVKVGDVVSKLVKE